MSQYPALPQYPDSILQQKPPGPSDGNQNHSERPQGDPVPPPYQFGANPYSDHQNGNKSEPQQFISAGKEKGNRLRKACDSCSIRKVKCDESGPPCRACAALDIPCTFERPSRRRGPPNRHVEAFKRRRVESPNAPPVGLSSPTSPSNIAATLASFSSHAVLSAESICPFSTLELLVDDFFTYIHPLVPFPHEPSFRAAFMAREDLNNPSFLALLASMVGALVASFPRKPRLHLKVQHREYLFPNSFSLVERCHKVAVEARGAGYLDKELTIYDAATSYFLGLAAAYTINWRQSRLYLSETLTMIRSLGVHRVKDAAYYSTGVMGPEGIPMESPVTEPIDYIKQEIGRRIFWVLFVGVRSMHQLGATYTEMVIPPPTPNDPYPPLPLEVDDQYIFVSHIEPQPTGIVSELTGFNLNIQVYLTCTPINTMELAYGIDQVFDWSRQKRVLEDCLGAVKRVLDTIPRELMLSPGSQPSDLDQAHSSLQGDRKYYPPLHDYPGTRLGGPGSDRDNTNGSSSPEAKRHLKYEIQKANIYASQLGTRSYIVEKYWNLFDAHSRRSSSREAEGKDLSPSQLQQTSPGAIASGLDGLLQSPLNPNKTTSDYDYIESHVVIERETIVKELLRVLGSISQVNMEPNGGSFINKIRQIASTLLDGPRMRKGPLALKTEEYLAKFLEILLKLERSSSAGPSGEGYVKGGNEAGENADAEEEELRNWADLAECQARFARSGGYAGDF